MAVASEQAARPRFSGGRLAGPAARLAGAPLLWAGVISLVLAVISGVAWPTIPSYDPFSWVVWGREVSDPHISFLISGGPSWKPLPFLFTTVYGLFGGVAPALWVITARAGGLLGLFGAYRLATVVAGRVGVGRAAPVAGVVAAVGVWLTTDWTYYFFRGTSEPLLIAMALWAVERALCGQRRTAWLLLCAEGLMRPEAWPFLLVYGVWLWRREPALRWWIVAGLVAQPVGWFVPPWISTGDPLLAATHAADYNGHLGSDPFLEVLRRGATLQPLPALVLGAAAAGLALWRGRERAVLWIAALIVFWWVVVVGMTLDGYPGLQRFFLPAAALTCVLGGVGLVWLAALAGELVAGIAGARLSGALLAGVVLIGACVPFLSSRVSFAWGQEPLAAVAVRRVDELGVAIGRLGGRQAMLPCRSSVVTINHSLQTALAWKLGTTLERVQTVLRRPGLAFVGPRGSVDGGPPPIAAGLSVRRFVVRVGAWRIYAVAAPGARPRCLGR